MTSFTTVFENHWKSRIQHCERSELRLHFEWPKVKSAKNSQIVLPDRSHLIGQILEKIAKIEKFKCDILSNFQTMWYADCTKTRDFETYSNRRMKSEEAIFQISKSSNKHHALHFRVDLKPHVAPLEMHKRA